MRKGFFQRSYLFSIIFWESFQFKNFEIEIRVNNEVLPNRFLIKAESISIPETFHHQVSESMSIANTSTFEIMIDINIF